MRTATGEEPVRKTTKTRRQGGAARASKMTPERREDDCEEGRQKAVEELYLQLWEHIGRALGNWVHRPQVMVEHLHPANAKATSDTTYHKAYANFESDRARFEEFVGAEPSAAIARAGPVVVEARRAAAPQRNLFDDVSAFQNTRLYVGA